MAKGDDQRARNRIDQQGGLAQNQLTNLHEGMLLPQAQNAQNNYTNATGRSFADYDNLMAGYKNFQDTGGYSQGDLSNIRSRALSPMRAVYANANREVDRSRALQGGYSPGFGVLKARMAREQSSGLSDAAGNTEAGIAQMVNAGKQFGLQGGTSQYSATPGMASHFGNMQNQTTNNLLQGQGLQNQLGLGLIDAQIRAGQLPGKWESTMSRITDIANLGTGLLSPFMGGKGIPVGGGSQPNPGGNIPEPIYPPRGPQIPGQYEGNIPEPLYPPPTQNRPLVPSVTTSESYSTPTNPYPGGGQINTPDYQTLHDDADRLWQATGNPGQPGWQQPSLPNIPRYTPDPLYTGPSVIPNNPAASGSAYGRRPSWMVNRPGVSTTYRG